MTNTQVFNLSTVGIYPFERYMATPITFNPGNLPQDFTSIFWSQLDGSGAAIPTGGSLITRNYLNYHRNPLCEVLGFDDANYNKFVNYENIIYTKFSNKFVVSLVGQITGARFIEKVSTATIYNTTTNGSTITLNTSAIRQEYKTPYDFYFFYIQLNDRTFNSYGYMLYPSRIFLNPKKITNQNGKWQLTTSVDVLSTTVTHIKSNEIEKDALDLHRTRLSNFPPNLTTVLPETLSAYNAYFSLYANRTFIDRQLINNTTPTTAYQLNNFGEIAFINPDSTFMSYQLTYNLGTENLALNQNTKNDSYLYSVQKMTPTFLLNYNPNLENQQNFKLLQNLINPSYELFDTRNTILSASVNLYDANFSFYKNNASINFIRPLTYNAMIDGYNLETIGIPASSTLTNGELSISSVNFSYNESILNGMDVKMLSASDVIWETEHPPYCYTYKLLLGDQAQNPVGYLDSYSLNFYLKLQALQQTTTNTSITAFAASDFNILKVPLSESDTINFYIKSTSLENDMDFINQIRCDYNGTPYDIVNSPFVQVIPGAVLNINYSESTFNGIIFSVGATAITRSGNLDSYDTLDISLAPPIAGTGNRIFLNIISEQSNEITIDASFNVTEEDWPARDLRNSKILWFYGNTPNLSLNYVDQFGAFISNVTGVDVFESKTWRVKLSGYGPQLATISLSSEKYNEVSMLSTNPLLYDFLSQGQLKVGPVKPLNNLDVTRVIELTAAVPYGDKTYNIPDNIPVNWTWEYDDISDPTIQPITVEEVLNNNENYLYGVDMKALYISAIKLKVTPPFSNTFPKVHTVKVIANINAVQPTITGSYSFKVDDFPDRSIFNCDFDTYYTAYISDPKYMAGSTRDDTNVITRSEKSVLNFTFSAKNDSLLLLNNGGNLIWGVDGVKTSIQNQQLYTIDLKDPLSGLSGVYIDNLLVSSININLTLENAYAPGWTSAHNVSATTYLYILSSIDFYKPLEFLIYPEYAWLGDETDEPGIYNSNFVTFLSTDPNEPNYFTNAFSPTAYFHKKSNSQAFWLSANKEYFSEYIYQNQQNFRIVSTASAYDILEIPYNEFSYTTFVGLPITLIAYNTSFYPENLKLNYIDQLTNETFVPFNLRIVDNQTTYLVTQNHQITAKTVNEEYTSDNVYSNFFKSPKLKLYNDILFKFVPYCNGIPQSTFNVQLSSGLISVAQEIFTSPLNSPAKVIDGTITYYLSTIYWVTSTTVPTPTESLSSFKDLFVIKYGDPSIPLYAGELGYSEMYLYAVPNLIQKIPATTFSKYSINFPRYPKDPDLWKEVIA
jgi:hypothetical protein